MSHSPVICQFGGFLVRGDRRRLEGTGSVVESGGAGSQGKLVSGPGEDMDSLREGVGGPGSEHGTLMMAAGGVG